MQNHQTRQFAQQITFNSCEIMIRATIVQFIDMKSSFFDPQADSSMLRSHFLGSHAMLPQRNGKKSNVRAAVSLGEALYDILKNGCIRRRMADMCFCECGKAVRELVKSRVEI